MTTYSTTFGEQLGSTDEKINATFQYCQDFNGDGYKDIKVSLSIDPGSNSGTEDMIGVAFDIQNDAVSGLQIVNIQRSTANGTLSTYTPAYVIGANQVSDGGPLDPGFITTGGGSDEPYDVGIKFSAQGSGEGIVQAASFLITKADTDLDAELLLENTDWWVRLQSTDGGEESAKTAGYLLDLPPCEDEPPPNGDGLAQTPGFWKNHPDIFLQETGKSLSGDYYEQVFGVDVKGSTRPLLSGNPTLGEALAAQGGGEAALLRSTTAGWANAMSDDTNYVIDTDALEDAVVGVYGLDPNSATFVTDRDAAVDRVVGIMEKVDLNDDGRIAANEVINAVQDVYGVSSAMTDFWAWTDVGAVASAFDAMNNMPHVDVSGFS
ncbi:hypothetical protein [Azospirillum soli]|uniref:hypothetical protein n=1 Tax=Azospirillum soli TaxID=1304799 RepID=UPI001AEA821A|nr:hypothetical protein [Azospirillum soli]MBP2310912.1 hypothetical protein [Azospirillum soli]